MWGDATGRENGRPRTALYSERLNPTSVLLMVRSLEHGGCERDATKLAVGLDRSRFLPHVGVFRPGGIREAELRAAGVPIVHFPVESFISSSAFRAARQLGHYVRQNNIQIVHAFDVPTDLFAAPAARWQRVPVVITAQLSYRIMYDRFGRIMLPLMDWLSDAIVVNSRAVADSLRRAVGFPKKKIYVCHNGVDTAQFYPARQRPPALKDASVVVGSVCVMRAEKRMDWVVRAFANVRQVDPYMRLLLVGSGPEVPRLEKLARDLAVRDICHFVPAQDNVVPWLQALDVYINSSSTESFPNGLLEAMACGCFPIGSRVGGIPELIVPGENGLLFDASDEDQLVTMLKRAVTDESFRSTTREKAALTARQEFSMEKNVSRMESLYERLLNQHVSGSRK